MSEQQHALCLIMTSNVQGAGSGQGRPGEEAGRDFPWKRQGLTWARKCRSEVRTDVHSFPGEVFVQHRAREQQKCS